MNGTIKLNPVNLHLLDVDGVPLKVRGSTQIRLPLCGLKIDQNFIVADALTSTRDSLYGFSGVKPLYPGPSSRRAICRWP